VSTPAYVGWCGTWRWKNAAATQQQRSNHWRQFSRTTGKSLNFYTQASELTALRAEIGFVKAVSQDALQRTLKDPSTAFGRFFKGLGGYP